MCGDLDPQDHYMNTACMPPPALLLTLLLLVFAFLQFARDYSAMLAYLSAFFLISFCLIRDINVQASFAVAPIRCFGV